VTRVHNPRQVINTNPEGGLKHHAVSADTGCAKLKFRSSMVLDNVPETQALDDVFWMAVYSLTMSSTANDTARFYNILLPFLTGRSLEESLVEAHTAAADAEAPGAYGNWRSPQRSNTSYVRCLLEAMDFMLRGRGVKNLDCKVVSVAIRAQMVEFVKRDLLHVRPDVNGAKIIEMACSQLSFATAKVAASWDHKAEEDESLCSEPEPEVASGAGVVDQAVSDEFEDALNAFVLVGETKKADQPDESAGTDAGQIRTRWFQAVDKIRQLVSHVSEQIVSILDDAVVPPPVLHLTGPESGEQKAGCTDAAEGDYDPAFVQSYDMLCPEVEQVPPDPGQAIPTPPYMAVDLTQVPRRVYTRDEAIDALRLCDRLCTLIENQKHCIKNRKFLIASFIQNVLTTVVPVPKPRAVGEATRARVHAERGHKRRAEQCRLVLVARQVLGYRDEKAAAAAAAATAAAEVAAGAAAAADNGGQKLVATGSQEPSSEPELEEQVIHEVTAISADDVQKEDQFLMRALLDAAASASVEWLPDQVRKTPSWPRSWPNFSLL
jgi:hypothetical protein